jgi:hypothetical protein
MKGATMAFLIRLLIAIAGERTAFTVFLFLFFFICLHPNS